MDDSIRSIFEMARLREKLASKNYKRLAGLVSSKNIKEVFTKLAEEEEVHERLFSKMDISILRTVNTMPLKRLSLLNKINKKNLVINDIKELNKSLEYAIKEEENAYNDYILLVKYLESGPAKETLKQIALQEQRHKILLENLKEKFNTA